MVGTTKAHLNKTKSMDMVSICLPTKDAIKDNLKMVYNTEMASLQPPTEKKALANGFKAKE